MRAPWYDEAFDERGTLRPAYGELRRRAGWDPLRPTAAVAERLRDRPLGDDTRILAVPLVIDEEEYRNVVQAGVAQRAKALQRLFADLVLGRQDAFAAGIGVDRRLCDDVLDAEGTSLASLRRLWRGRDRDAIRFVYGPDLVRDADGRWVVLEDNVGCLGGSADAFFVADRYRAATGLARCPGCDRRPDLAVAFERWLDRLAPVPDDGVAAVLGCDSGDGPSAVQVHENARRRLILSELGIPILDNDGLGRWLIEGRGRARALLNFAVGTASTWREAFLKSDVAMLNAPGTGALGNKALLPYLDDVIRFYTGEEPILPTPRTRPLDDGALPADLDNWVVKSAAGCQGTEVFVLKWQPRERIAAVEQLARTTWSGAAAVAQRYVEPSRLSSFGPGAWDGYRVEIRPVTYVLDWQDVHVCEQPLGKVVSNYDLRRLNNVSLGALYAAVLREPCHHRRALS